MLSSFPLTSSDRARLQPLLGYFYFCRFLLFGRGSNSNWTSSSGLVRDRQVRARTTDGEGKSGRMRNNPRIKDPGFPSMTLLSSPRLSACLRSLSASSPACELYCLLDMINGPGLHRIAGFGFSLQSSGRCVPLCLLVGRWRVSWSSPRGWGGTFFPLICTEPSCFFLARYKRPLIKIPYWNYISFNFPCIMIPPSSGHLRESFFAGFIGDRELGGHLCVFKANLCVSWQGCVVQEKGGCLLPNVGLADSIKKISKGPLWGAVKKKGCFESTTRLQG